MPSLSQIPQSPKNFDADLSDSCDLLRRCLKRRRSRDWREFLRRHDGRIRGSLRKARGTLQLRTGRDELEELTQEFYCRLLQSDPDGFDGEEEYQLWAYLARIAKHLVVDRYRAATRLKRRAVSEAHPDMSHLRPSRGPSPEGRLIQAQGRLRILRRLTRSIPGQRTPLKVKVLRLALLEGWSSREISRLVRGAISPSQIDSLIWRFRDRLVREGLRLPRRPRSPSLPAETMRVAKAHLRRGENP